MGKIGPLAAHEISDIIFQLSLHLKIWWPKYRPAPNVGGSIRSMPEILTIFPAPKPNEKPSTEEGPFFLTKTIADRVIIETLCNYNIQDFFLSFSSARNSVKGFGCQYDYLAYAYANLCNIDKIYTTIQESNRFPLTDEQKMIANHTIELLKGLIISYLSLLLQEPEVFTIPSSLNVSDVVVNVPKRVMLYAFPQMFPEGNSGTLFPDVAGKEILRRIMEFSVENSHECLLKVVEASVTALMGAAKNVTSFNDIMVVDSMFASLVSYKGVPEAMVELPQWMGTNSSSGLMLELTSILGVLFGMSCTLSNSPVSNAALEEFRDLETAKMSDVAAIKKSMYSRMEHHHTQLLAFVKAFFKASPRTEEAVLNWIAAVLNSNAERSKSKHDNRILSSPGLLFNLLVVLLMISQSLKDHIGNIQRSYLSCSKRLDLHNETRIATSLNEYLSVMENSANAARLRTLAGSDAKLTIKNDIDTSEVPNRHSECFFLTMRCFHLAFTCSVDEIKQIRQAYSYSQGTPRATQLLKISAVLEVFAESEHLLGLAGIFWSIFTRWALAIVCPSKKQGVEYDACVPLPSEVPLSFALIPESTITDIAVYVKYTAQINKLLIPVSKINDIMNFLVCFIASRSYVKEFAVRKNLLDALISLVPNGKDAGSLIIEDVFCSHQLSKRYLIPALIRFSTDAEFTGSSSQYYDKFNYRIEAQILYKHVLQFPDYKQCFASYVASPDEPEVVAKFAKYIVDDINYMFEEALENAQRVQSLTKEIAKNSRAASDPTMNENLSEAKDRLKNIMFMLTQNIEFLLLVVRISVAPFTSSETALRSVSNMATFSLQKLSLNSSSLLSIGDSRYDFNPATLRASISEVIAKFTEIDQFASLCAENPGFTDELIETTASLISPRGYVEARVANVLLDFNKKVAEVRASNDDDIDLDPDEAPEEYLDPISGDIMKNPVYLPSKNIVDQSTVDSLLMNDPTDPYTRLAFTKDDIVPVPELKEKIEAYIKEQKALRK